MTNLELNLLVLRSADLQKSVGFYGVLGLVFVEEQHGNGPVHYSSQIGVTLLELYPLGKRKPTSDVRLGFTVDSVNDAIASFDPETIISAPSDTERGRLAIIQDPDGHTVEILERAGE